MQELVRTIIILAALFAQHMGAPLLKQPFVPQFLSGAPGELILLGIIFLIALGIDRLLAKPWNWRWLRQSLFPQARCEGVWAQRVDHPERKHSVGLIQFEEGQWVYRGIAYDQQFRPAARWDSIAISHRMVDDKWIFRGKGMLLHQERADVRQVSDEFKMQSELTLTPRARRWWRWRAPYEISEGFAIDVSHSRTRTGLSGFWITPKRAVLADPNERSIEGLRHLSPSRVKGLFQDLGLL